MSWHKPIFAVQVDTPFDELAQTHFCCAGGGQAGCVAGPHIKLPCTPPPRPSRLHTGGRSFPFCAFHTRLPAVDGGRAGHGTRPCRVCCACCVGRATLAIYSREKEVTGGSILLNIPPSATAICGACPFVPFTHVQSLSVLATLSTLHTRVVQNRIHSQRT